MCLPDPPYPSRIPSPATGPGSAGPDASAHAGQSLQPEARAGRLRSCQRTEDHPQACPGACLPRPKTIPEASREARPRGPRRALPAASGSGRCEARLCSQPASSRRGPSGWSGEGDLACPTCSGLGLGNGFCSFWVVFPALYIFLVFVLATGTASRFPFWLLALMSHLDQGLHPQIRQGFTKRASF